jgi:hypothetical protein
MPRVTFRRLSKTGNSDGSDDLSATKIKQRRKLFDPGEYDVTASKAELVTNKRRTGDVSVALELHDADNPHELIDLRPLWVAGPNADRGTLAERNQGILIDLLTAAGVAESSYSELTNTVLNSLIGKTFGVELGIDQGRMGGTFNTIVRVFGAVEDEDETAAPVVPLKPAATAD